MQHVTTYGHSIGNLSIWTISSLKTIFVMFSPHRAMHMVVSMVKYGVDLDVPDEHNLTQTPSQLTQSKLNLFSF